MKQIFDVRLLVFLAASFSGFYFGDMSFSQASIPPVNTEAASSSQNLESRGPSALAQAAAEGATAPLEGPACMNLSGSYNLADTSDCSEAEQLPNLEVLGCSDAPLKKGSGIEIEQTGCNKLSIKVYGDVGNSRQLLSTCDVNVEQHSVDSTIVQGIFGGAAAHVTVTKNLKKAVLNSRHFKSKISLKAEAANIPVHLIMKAGLKIKKDGSLFIKGMKSSGSEPKALSKCTLKKV